MNKPTVAVLLLTIMASATKVMAINLDVDNDTRVCNDQTGAPFCTIQGALDVSRPETEPVFNRSKISNLRFGSDSFLRNLCKSPRSDR